MTTKTVSVGEFNKLFLAQYAPLSRLLCRVVGAMGWAEDLAAEAFLKLYRQPPGSTHNLAGWLYTTGLRLALDNLKKRKRQAHYESQAPLPKATENPEDAINSTQQQGRVRNILATLNPEQSSLLLLRSQGYSLNEIASLLSIAPNSVGTFLARADRAFRKEYTAQYGER